MSRFLAENDRMVIRGRVEKGVVVLLDDASALPEGAEVIVSYPAAPKETETPESRKGKRVQLPLVPSKRPGTRRLTADRVVEILDENDHPC